jgi:hypothetical protein
MVGFEANKYCNGKNTSSFSNVSNINELLIREPLINKKKFQHCTFYDQSKNSHNSLKSKKFLSLSLPHNTTKKRSIRFTNNDIKANKQIIKIKYYYFIML